MTPRDLEILSIVDKVAAQSKDLRAHVGAVITTSFGTILSTGYNEFANGTQETETRRSRPEKYFYTEHAERNAIYAAASKGTPLHGGTMFQNWFPCAECARAIVQSGLRRLVCQAPDFGDVRWGESFTAASNILREGTVHVEYYQRP